MARPFPSIRKPSAGWTGAVNYTLEDHIASPYPHPIYPRKDGILPNDSITRHMADAGAHRKYFLSTSELIFTKADYEASVELNGATITDPTTRESRLYQYLITAPALAAILADYNSSGGLGYESLVKEILGAPGSHTYTMCTAEDDIKAPSIGLFVGLFDKFNAVVGILPSQSKPTAESPTPLTSVFAFKSHPHAAYESRGASHNEIWDAINAVGGGSGGMGGVIDGTLCTDAATGQPCVTEIELYDGTNPNNRASYTYTVQHNCLLFIQLKNAIIADNESSSVPRDCILVKAGEQVIGTLTDNLQDMWNDLDNDGLRIPVKAGTTITLVGDGTTPIFDESSLTTDSKIVFSEFELTPLSMRIGLPDYNTPTDITDNVCRTDIDVSKNYTAAADGFVLFRFNSEKYGVDMSGRALGKVAQVEVFNSIYNHISSGSDYSVSSGMVPVRKGDVIDFMLTNSAASSIITNDGIFDVIFYPLVGAEHTEGEGPIEYPVFEHAFTDTTDNPFIGTSIPSAADLTITSAKIEELCGRSNIDLSTCNISLKIDVFTPKMDGSTVVVDDNGFAEINKTYPVYRNEAIVYCDADNSPSGYYNDYSRHLDVSIVGGAAKIAWTEAFKKDPATNSVAASFPLPALSSLVAANTGKTTWDDFNNSYGKFIDVASDLGLSDCYIRLTAVIDPCTKIINQTVAKAGMFIDGEINKDDSGKVCKTYVKYTDWNTSDGTTPTPYKYTYVAKTDCLLFVDMLIGSNSNGTAYDYTLVRMNEQLINIDGENGSGVLQRSFNLPVKKGTTLEFARTAPATDGDSRTDPDAGNEKYVMRIIEFKMSTELTPAKFPSLAVRICDVDCHEESTNASVLPAGSTCEYFTWTESQMRQVFGSAFDFDHARFDVSAVFYVGNSASDYDTAANKLQDDGILISPTSQGQQVRPSVTIDTVNGERVAKLALPGIDYFCSTVKSDTTDGFKLVTRTDGAHLSIGSSGNNLIGDFSSHGKKVRMRLLLHVSDRRGEMADGGRLPNGISPNSKMVRQGDMNLIATTSGAQYTYSNEITITESGWCVIHANYDSDGGITDGGADNGVAIEAFINNAWTVIAYKHSGEGYLTLAEGAGAWSFEFNVEAGTKLRAKTNFNADETVPLSYRVNTFIPYTRRQQALCWVIPTSKYLAPEYNLPGSAGVIDGSVWKDENGDPVGDTVAVTAYSTKSINYNVKNDCMLSIRADRTIDITGNSGTYHVGITVNGTEVIPCVAGTTADGELNRLIPVASGSVVKIVLLNNLDGSESSASGVGIAATNCNILFTEFKLRATNVVAAMPDWDTDKKVPLSSGDIAPADGWIVVYPTQTDSNGTVEILINNVHVLLLSRNSTNTWQDCNGGTFPVSKGDIITWTGDTTVINPGVTFYPVKMHEVPTTSASAIEVIAMSSRSVAPSWWKVYSNGWCEQGGQKDSFSAADYKEFDLPIEMDDTSYTAQTSTEFSGTSAATGETYVTGKTTKKLTVYQKSGNSKTCYSLSGWISDATLLAIKNGTYTFFPGRSET